MQENRSNVENFKTYRLSERTWPISEAAAGPAEVSLCRSQHHRHRVFQVSSYSVSFAGTQILNLSARRRKRGVFRLKNDTG